MKEKELNNLFSNWLEIELRDKSLSDVLNEINEACGTAYKHNWPAKMAAAGYTLERLPRSVRQYMMMQVVPELVDKNISEEALKRLVDGLT